MRWEKTVCVVLISALWAFSGCVSSTPVVSKSSRGNLAINVAAPNGFDIKYTELYLDDHFIGNVSSQWPILYVKKGLRRIRATLKGCKTIEKNITILGEPNHQTLNLNFEIR